MSIYISRNFNESLDTQKITLNGVQIYISRNFNESLDEALEDALANGST